jgi:hypothetical protein
VTSATVPTTGNACLKQAAATPVKGKLLMPMIHGPALPVQNEKKNRIIYSQKRVIVEVSWNPTWEPEELQNTCKASSRASKSLKSKSLHQTYLSLHQMNT